MTRVRKPIIAFLLAFASVLGSAEAWACELCKDNQPQALRNITHGTGPQGEWDWIIIWSAVVIVGFTLFLSLKFLIKPGEKRPGHIKHIVVED